MRYERRKCHSSILPKQIKKFPEAHSHKRSEITTFKCNVAAISTNAKKGNTDNGK